MSDRRLPWEASRLEMERDAAVLDWICSGCCTYAQLAERRERPELDETLDRMTKAGYIEFRFVGRVVKVTPHGHNANVRVKARGWRYGRLVDANLLYPHPASYGPPTG